MTQNALRKEPDTQTGGQVSEALSSIRSVIKQNLEQGFDHFNDPQVEENEEDGKQGTDTRPDAEKPLKKEKAPEELPLETKESLEALIKESEKKEAPLKKAPDSADIFVLTQVLEEDGSVTDLDNKTKKTDEPKTGKIEITQTDAETESPAAPEASEKEEPSADKEAPSAEEESEASKILDEAEEMKEEAVAEIEKKAAETVEADATEFDPVAEGGADVVTQEASQDVEEQETIAEAEKHDVPAPKFSEKEALILDTPIQETVPKPEAAAPDFEIGVEEILEKATKAPVEDLASKKTMAESAAAFSELANIARQLSSKSKNGGGGDGPSDPVTPERAGGYTVEELMRELLRPMLKDWLDTHLPSLVKWLVTEQIEKMLQGQGMSTGQPSTSAPPSTKPAEPAAEEPAKAASDEDFDAESMDFDAPGGTSAA